MASVTKFITLSVNSSKRKEGKKLMTKFIKYPTQFSFIALMKIKNQELGNLIRIYQHNIIES